METSTDSIYVFNEKGDLQEANAAFLRRRGYTAPEVKGLNVADWDAQWSREELQERRRKLVGSSAVFETRHRCKDGSVFDVEVCATSVRIDGGPLFFCVARDITERKQSEQALRESEERFRELAENIDDIFWLTDLQHKKVLYISPAYERIWGRTCESLYASIRSWTESLHPEDRERILALRGDDHLQEMPDMTYRIVRPDGSLRWIHQREFPVKDADGAVVRVAGIVEDITERKRVELALDERLRFETLLTELSATFANLPTTTVDQEIDHWLQKLVEVLDLDRAAFDQVGEDGMTLSRSHSHTARDIDPRPLNAADDQTPWITKQVLRGNLVKWSRLPDEIPEEASKEKEFVGRIGAKSALSIPVCIGGSVICAISFTSMRSYRDWPDEMVARLRLVGENFANAIARKRAGEKIRQHQWELQQVIDVVHQHISVIGADGRRLYANQRLLQYHGITIEEFRADNFPVRVIHPEDFEEVMRKFLDSVRSGVPVELEVRLRRYDGHYRWFLHRTNPSLDEEGRITRWYTTRTDIQDRKQAEDALRESEERFRELAENIHDVFWMTSLDSNRAIYVSPAYEEIWGRTRESLYRNPQSWLDAISERDRARVVETVEGKRARNFELTYRVVRPDGSIRWIRDRAFPVKDKTGRVYRMAGIAADVTEHKQAEDRLRRSEEKFKTLFGIAPVGISVLDRERNIVDANPALEQITRLPKEDLFNGVHRHRTYLNSDGSRKPVDELPSTRAIRENRPFNDVETGIVMESGEIVWTQVSAAPLALPDASAVVITRDITERKRAAKELEEANHQLRLLSRRLFEVQEKERRHLARELHDEIGQALTAAKINLQSVADSKRGSATFARLQESIAILDRLVVQVRQISLDLRPSMLDDLGLVPALRSLLDQQGRRASVAVGFSARNMPEKLDPEIQTTCFRIAQEAITNVVRHSAATHIDVALRSDGGDLGLVIRDDGSGFEVMATQAQTVGLGLIGIKERAALVGGWAKILSSPTKGTTIEVSLPLTPRPERPDRHPDK